VHEGIKIHERVSGNYIVFKRKTDTMMTILMHFWHALHLISCWLKKLCTCLKR